MNYIEYMQGGGQTLTISLPSNQHAKKFDRSFLERLFPALKRFPNNAYLISYTREKTPVDNNIISTVNSKSYNSDSISPVINWSDFGSNSNLGSYGSYVKPASTFINQQSS